jgi:hypothetical protein
MLARILLFGRDEHLLTTRTSVLNRTGLPILSASSLEEVEAISTTQNIAMLALCPSVPAGERRKAIAIVRHQHPEVLTSVVDTKAGRKLTGRATLASAKHLRHAFLAAHPPAGTF